MDTNFERLSIVTVDDPAQSTAASPRAVASERRPLIALGFGTFVGALVFIIPPLFFPQMARDLGVGVPLLGQIMSAMLGLSVLLGLVVGPLADRSGFRLLIVTGLAGAATCLLGALHKLAHDRRGGWRPVDRIDRRRRERHARRAGAGRAGQLGRHGLGRLTG